jgi:hypothetical protein
MFANLPFTVFEAIRMIYFQNCRFRERQKEKGITMKKKHSKVLTRKERTKQREYWRIKQRESRERRHPQKIGRKKEKDRKKLREKRLIIKLKAKEREIGMVAPQKMKVGQAILESIKDSAIGRKKLHNNCPF